MKYHPNLREEELKNKVAADYFSDLDTTGILGKIDFPQNNTVEIKAFLLNKLKEEKAFWSYDPNSVTLDSISDEMLIALTLRHLDLEEINLLYEIYSPKMIKEAWKNQLVPEGDYLRTLNRFIAWFYFKIKNPDRYLKILETKHFNKLLKV